MSIDVCKYCGSSDWKDLGWSLDGFTYRWLCLYCEKITSITLQQLRLRRQT
jgi:hypothetical protein